MRPTPFILQQILPRFDGSEEINSVVGGDVSDAYCVRSTSGAQHFVKSIDGARLSNFQAEADGIASLRSAVTRIEGLVVPELYGVFAIGGAAWLSMRWMDGEHPSGRFFEDFGSALAKLHRHTLLDDQASKSIGWHIDNFLGAAPQINTPMSSWNDFFAEHRLGHQLRWAVDQGLASTGLKRGVQQMIRDLPNLLDGRNPATSLLHGDLWSGNFMNAGTSTVLIDPAVYRGCREAEFGMLKLFGGCPRGFYDAYEEEFPMPSGCWRRVSVYLLYHLLNHLNLFGTGYLSRCEAGVDQILRKFRS